MIKNFTLFALSVLLLTIFGSCTKDSENTANPGGSAIYTMTGSPSACTSPATAGLYSANLPLTGSNTITVSVNVVAKGSYNLYTNNSNGVYFTGSGTFTTTGPQSVVLTGKGTPKAAGTFNFVLATVNTCSFSVNFNSGAAAASFTYAGAPGNCTAPIISGTYAVGTALVASNYVDLTVNVVTTGTYAVSTAPVNGISFSATGSFASAGTAVLRLQGSGTPASATSSTFTPSGGGCGFSIAVVPPLPPAAFTYTNCASVVPNGTYAAGTALNASNTVVLNVNVTTPGAYSVSTGAAVNGVSFSASGSFTAAGPNTITLTSTSTPTAGGLFSYSPAGGCSFDVTYTAAPPPPSSFIKFTVDGGPLLTFAVNPNGFDDNSSAPYNITVDADLTSAGDNFSISVTDENSPVVTAFDFKNRNLLASPTKYCEIVYTTGSGFPYGSQIAASNSFTVRLTSLNATTVTGTFSGRVYDNLGTGTTFKTIGSGTFSINF